MYSPYISRPNTWSLVPLVTLPAPADPAWTPPLSATRSSDSTHSFDSCSLSWCWWRDWTLSLDCSPFHWSVGPFRPFKVASPNWWISWTPRHTRTRPRGKINVTRSLLLIRKVDHDKNVSTLKYSRETGTNNFLTTYTFKYNWHDWQQWVTQRTVFLILWLCCDYFRRCHNNSSLLCLFSFYHRRHYFAIFWTWSVCCIKSDLVWLFLVRER